MGGPGNKHNFRQGEASSSNGFNIAHIQSNVTRVPSTTGNIDEVEDDVLSSSRGSLDKKKRGRTRNLALSRKRNAKEKLEIDIPQEINRIVGVNSQYAITEAGCLTRRFAPLQVAKWAKIDEHKKLGLLRDFKGSFNYEESQHCDTTIFKQMNTQYRNYWHKLYKNYFLKGIVPPHVTSEDWEYLTNYFSSNEYKAMSKRNKKSRESTDDDTKHIAGTKSFARICREKENEKGDVVGQIELYKLTRYIPEDEFGEGYWVSEGAKEKYCKMLELQNKKLEGGELTVDEENICGEVLGFKSGYIRGRGSGPKPKRCMPHQNYGKELEEARRNAKLPNERAEEAEQQVMILFDKLDKQQSVIQELKEGLIATQKTMVESQRSTTEMVSFFDQFRRMSQFPAMSPRFSGPPNQSQHNMQGLMHGIASHKIQSSSKESDVFSNEPELQELFREVGKYPASGSFS